MNFFDTPIFYLIDANNLAWVLNRRKPDSCDDLMLIALIKVWIQNSINLDKWFHTILFFDIGSTILENPYGSYKLIDDPLNLYVNVAPGGSNADEQILNRLKDLHNEFLIDYTCLENSENNFPNFRAFIVTNDKKDIIKPAEKKYSKNILTIISSYSFSEEIILLWENRESIVNIGRTVT